MGTIEKAGRRRAGSGREKREVPPSPFLSRIPLAADPTCRPLAFSIVLTDREPGKGYGKLLFQIAKEKDQGRVVRKPVNVNPGLNVN